MGKQMKTNSFSDAILESWEYFNVFDCLINKTSEKPQLRFKWNFRSYDGFGEIDFDESLKVRNKFGDNFSNLSLSSVCRKTHPAIKPTDSLYNDSGLEIIFQRILDMYFKNHSQHGED